MSTLTRLKAAAHETVTRSARLRRQLRARSWKVWPRAWRRPFDVVDSHDVWAYLAELTQETSRILADQGIEHLVLPDRMLPRPIVAVREEDAGAAVRALADDPRSRTWWLASIRGDAVGSAAPIRRRRASGQGAVIARNLVSPGGIPLVHSELGVQLEFWSRLTEFPGGGQPLDGTYATQRQNGLLGYAGPGLWAQVQQNAHRLPVERPHLLQVTEPVDLVYTWVDGDDPSWLARKNRYLGGGDEYTPDAAIDARFNNRDELRYSLRSVQMFANWARHIWLVTDDQVPGWLVPDERLTVVDHRQIFADPDALPVFNSHAIESQLHHIPGLADQFIYLNDDLLFGAPVRPEDFFHGNGISKFFTSAALLDVNQIAADDIAVAAAAKNNRSLIETEFDRTISNKLRHTPHAHSRLLLEEFEATHPSLFDQVMRSRFRQATDYSLLSSLAQYYAYAKGRAVTDRIRYGYVNIADAHPHWALERWLRTRNLKCLCINDSGDDDPATRPAKEAGLHDFFENYYPVPSRWERTG